MAYDQITKDLCSKAQDDCLAAVERSSQFLDDPADRMMVAVSASAGCFAAASGYISAMVKAQTGEFAEPAAAIDALWEMIRPIVLKSSGGDDAPYLALLEKMPS
jgi:hypothetical protein